MLSSAATDVRGRRHPRTIGWVGTTALAMGGSNQSLFLLGALFASQGTAAVPLLAVGLLLSWMALPGWTELIMMWPNRVGGIAATCAEAFRPYSPVLANLTGFCYWWGWVPTCGLTAILSGEAIHEWYLPWVPVPALASGIVVVLTVVNLAGIRWVTRLAIPVAFASAGLALTSAVVPVLTGHVDWHRAAAFHLESPFHGVFGGLTSAMAGLYLVGFAAPAFEAAACHVGETVDAERNVPRAMLASALVATVYFVVLPSIWLGALGAGPLTGPLIHALGPTFAPVLGIGAQVTAIWFMVFNMLHGTLQPLAGASRTLMQLAEDGLLPRILAKRSRTDAPLAATLLTAGMSIAFLLTGDPTWVIAAANLTYLIGICLPSVAVWLLRRNDPERERLYRAPRFTVGLGVVAAAIWMLTTILGFEQFGLPTVLAGIGLAYSGSVLYAYRVWSDRRRAGLPRFTRSLHTKLTGAMLLVLVLDGGGYLLAVARVDAHQHAMVTALEDIFVAVALLTISVGLVLPGVISHALAQVATAADRLATGTLADLTRAMDALADGDLDRAQARVTVEPVVVYSRDEVGAMAASFNAMQEEAAHAAVSLDAARRGLRQAKDDLERLAFNDSLTGLANRGMFSRLLELELARAARTGSGVAVLYVDLDDFKLVNDSFGHSIGDELLRQVAARLTTVTRDHDVVARTGGDEFLLLLGGFDPNEVQKVDGVVDAAEQMATRIRDILHEPFLLAGNHVHVSASVGASIYPIDAQDRENLLQHADIAMYDAKRAGRSAYHVYARGADEARTLLTTTTDLHRALDQGEFILHYQPIVDLRSGKLVSVEALIRWQRRGHGLVAPDRFLPIAERAGLMGDISRWVLRECCKQARAWQEMDVDLRVGFNLPPVLWQPAVLDQILTTLDEYGLSGDRLAIEITESALQTDFLHTSPALTDLRRRGVEIAIDDFGTGHSSLSRLTKIPATMLKVDRAFVRDVPNDPESVTLVSAIIQLANNLGLAAVAEGVETEAQQQFLLNQGCVLGQGYLFSRPVAPERIQTLYRSPALIDAAAR